MQKLQIVKTSMPEFELGNVKYALVYSPALNMRRCELCFYLPPQLKGMKKVPLVVMLHGVEGCPWDWVFRGGLRVRAQKLIDAGEIEPMAFVMPTDGNFRKGSGYLPLSDGDYGKWIVDDVLEASKSIIEEVDETSNIFLCGQSMGGYGSLMLGGKYPEKFTALSALAPLTTLDDMFTFLTEENSEHYRPIDASEPVNVIDWLTQNKHRLPPFRFDCGTDDVRLIEQNRKLHSELSENNILHLYEEFPGDHDWDYFGLGLEKSLSYFNSIEKGKCS